MSKPKEVNGEYSSDQQTVLAANNLIIDFAYTFGATVGNALNKDSYLEIWFLTDFEITLNEDDAIRNK